MANPKVRLPFDGNQRLTQGFGERPEVYRARFGLPGHNGIGWGMPIGTPIVAVDDGKVIVRITSATGFGRYIKLQHNWGQSLYAHLSQFEVEDINIVEPPIEDVIAEVFQSQAERVDETEPPG